MKKDLNIHFEFLIEAIKILASPSEVQIKLFPKFVSIPTEIAETLCDRLYFLDEMVEAGIIPEEISNKIKSLDSLTTTFNEDETLWIIDALENRKEWQVARDEGKNILENLGIKLDIPSLSGVTYVEVKEMTTNNRRNG